MLAQHLASQTVWSNYDLSPVCFVPLLLSGTQNSEVCCFMCGVPAGWGGVTVNVPRNCYTF